MRLLNVLSGAVFVVFFVLCSQAMAQQEFLGSGFEGVYRVDAGHEQGLFVLEVTLNGEIRQLSPPRIDARSPFIGRIYHRQELEFAAVQLFFDEYAGVQHRYPGSPVVSYLTGDVVGVPFTSRKGVRLVRRDGALLIENWAPAPARLERLSQKQVDLARCFETKLKHHLVGLWGVSHYEAAPEIERLRPFAEEQLVEFGADGVFRVGNAQKFARGRAEESAYAVDGYTRRVFIARIEGHRSKAWTAHYASEPESWLEVPLKFHYDRQFVFSEHETPGNGWVTRPDRLSLREFIVSRPSSVKDLVWGGIDADRSPEDALSLIAQPRFFETVFTRRR